MQTKAYDTNKSQQPHFNDATLWLSISTTLLFRLASWTVESVCSSRLSMNVHIMAGLFSMDSLYVAGNTPLQVGDILVKFEDILRETSKSSACWDMGGNSHLTCQHVCAVTVSICPSV